MAAITKRLLHLRPTIHSYALPYSTAHRHFSSSSDRDDSPPSEPSKPDSSSSLNDVRVTLQNDSPQSPRDSFLFSSGARLQTPPPSEEIRNRLAKFRDPSAQPPPPPPPPSGEKYASLFDLYEKNIKSPRESFGSPSQPGAGGGAPSSDFIRESLKSLGTAPSNLGRKPVGSSVSRLSDSMGLKIDPTGKFGAGTGSSLLTPKESKHGDLNVKLLKELRPVKRKGKWFSLQEMNDRLAKAKEIEDQEREKRMGVRGVFSGMITFKDSDLKKQTAQQRIAVSLSGVSAALEKNTAGPPKDHLVEKYFHPDNMSSAEKMKLELAKVRDEFKISEFDCGSTRVQVAQLTTKIKHLESALHKKDKHSRRGLTLMVQKRRKLLKYLRRTDWDSYCLVLEKLGLRDNPDKSMTGARTTTS